MTEEHQSQLEQFEEYLNNTLGKMVAKYAVRFTWMVIVLTIAATGWASKMQSDLSSLREAQAEMKLDLKEVKAVQASTNTATMTRIVDWSQWRVMKDAIDDNYERRMAWLETVERGRKP